MNKEQTNYNNPLQGYLSECCGAEHDPSAEHHILNESIRGGCSECRHYAEFVPEKEVQFACS